MELLLNLLWLAIAIASLLAFFRLGSADRRQFRLGLGALLCVLTLLLPAISITDDLHFETFANEDSNPTKRLVKISTYVSPVSQVVWFALSLLPLLFVDVRRKSWVVENTSDIRPQPQFCKPILGRAPPLVLV